MSSLSDLFLYTLPKKKLGAMVVACKNVCQKSTIGAKYPAK